MFRFMLVMLSKCLGSISCDSKDLGFSMEHCNMTHPTCSVCSSSNRRILAAQQHKHTNSSTAQHSTGKSLASVPNYTAEQGRAAAACTTAAAAKSAEMVTMTAYILEEVILEAQAARKALHDHLHHLMALEHEVQHLIPVNMYVALVLQRYTQTH